MDEGLVALVAEGRITEAPAMRLQENRERELVVEDCTRFLEHHEAGILPDADPEAVRLAGVVVEAAQRTGIGLGPEVRELTAEFLAAESRFRLTGEGEREAEEAGRRMMDTIREAETEMDGAAEGLARLAGA